jgi:uroporphyrin-III C-methyltransferase/precorrin-2 dehydrogenase/sirohydrochlorin ferrochelatase
MSNVKSEPVSALRDSRIGPLANLPVFFKLDGKRVVLVGGGEPALWKAELLAATGASVEVFAETFAEGFSQLAAAPADGKVILSTRRWRPDDLAGAALAVGAFSDDAEASAFASAARAAGVPVNVVDRPAFCDFQFGAIINRSPLVVGISTDGAAPVFGQAIRSLVESLLPESFRHWAAAARDLRRDGGRFGDTPDSKRRFWQRFADYALRNSERPPTDADLETLIEGREAPAPARSVTIIDIGETADTLTLGAIRALRAADDIFFDENVPAAVLDFARREARRHPLSSLETNLAAANGLLVSAATNGGRVLRLRRNADGSTGRDNGEAEALRAAGIAVIGLS